MLHQIIEPISPLPIVSGRRRPMGLVAGTLVRTVDGDLPVEHLLPGDRIITADGEIAELRWTVAIDARNLDVIKISPMAREAGCKRAEQELTLPAAQRVRIHDWRAVLLHGTESMMTPASSLVDDFYITRTRIPRARLIRLHFDSAQVFFANGVEVACGSLKSGGAQSKAQHCQLH